jgi:hypothetical protein
MEEHKDRFACLIPLGLRWRFRPDIQGETIFSLFVPKMCRELIEDIEAITSEVGESRHRRDVCRAVCALSSGLVTSYRSHAMDLVLPSWKPRKQSLQERYSAWARQISVPL